MAQSPFPSEQYMSESFVEAAGAILFRLSTREICILHLLKDDEYVLPKGRRNCSEARETTATREVTEETGFSCRLLPVDMHARCPPVVETEDDGDRVRFYKGVCEPVALQLRRWEEGKVKLIWWYVAAVDENAPPQRPDSEEYEAEFFEFDEVLRKLTFQMDREVVERAIALVKNTYAEL